MPNVMVALPNIGSALCSAPQSLADAHYTRVPYNTAVKARNPVKFAGVPQTRQRISAVSIGGSLPYYEDMWRKCCCLTFFRLSIHALVPKI